MCTNKSVKLLPEINNMFYWDWCVDKHRASPGPNSEASYQARRKRLLMETHQEPSQPKRTMELQ